MGASDVSLRSLVGTLSPPEIALVLDALLEQAAVLERDEVVHGHLTPELVTVTPDWRVTMRYRFGTTAAGTTFRAEVLRRCDARYLAPEQLAGEPVTPATDLHAIGCIAFELVTGSAPPRRGPDGVPADCDPREIDPSVAPAVARWIRRMTARDPERRPAGCAVARDELVAAIAERGSSPAAARVAPPGPAPSARLLHELVAGVALEHVRGAPRPPSPLADPMPAPQAPPPAPQAAAPAPSAPPAPAPQAGRQSRVGWPLGHGGSPDSIPLPVARAAPRLIARLAKLVGLAGAAVLAGRLLGLFTLDAEIDPPADTVDLTVFAPPAARPGESILVQVFAHLPIDAPEARALATEFDVGAARRAVKGLETPVARGSKLALGLAIPGADVDDPVQSLVWRGRPTAAQFSATVPAGAPAGSLIATVTVTQDSVPIGHVKFKLAVDPASTVPDAVPVGDGASRYRSAFLSYASEDRDEAIRCTQALRLAGIECFQDVTSLRPGERWEPELYRQIEGCDLFVLLWSRAASESEWVRKEALHALACRRSELDPPEIKPYVLERPPPLPWPELGRLHFNDPLVYFVSTAGSA